MKKRNIIICLALLAIFLLIVLINIKSNNEIKSSKVKESETNSIIESSINNEILEIPAIVNDNNVNLKIEESDDNLILLRGDRVTIVEENEDTYLIELNEKRGKVEKNKISYFKLNETEKYSLAVDVSQYNIVGKELVANSNKTFKDNIDFANFIINNNINYAYIRLGGRGWGTKGNMYYDDNVNLYIDICEYLKIPYGFYFLDEALNDEEVIEEVKFIKEFLDKENLNMNILPIAMDLEYQHGKGRTDNSWDTRVPLINKLVEEFNKIGIDTIIYANGARIETYLKDANCNFWTAMYPKDNKIPETDYKTIIKEEQNKNDNNPELIEQSFLNTKLNKCGTETITYSDEYLNKVRGWQFTEDGAISNGINTYMDLSILDNEYFKIEK